MEVKKVGKSQQKKVEKYDSKKSKSKIFDFYVPLCYYSCAQINDLKSSVYEKRYLFLNISFLDISF